MKNVSNFNRFWGILCMVLISSISSAQIREVNLETKLVYPNPGHTYHHGKQDSAILIVYNEGPDRLLQDDRFSNHFEYGAIIEFPTFGILDRDVAAGDSLILTYHFTLRFKGDADSTTYCSYLTFLSISGDSIRRSDGTKNDKIETCVSVNFRDSLPWALNLQDGQKMINQFKLTQTHDGYRIQSEKPGKIEFEVRDLNGKLITNGVTNPWDPIPLHATSGIYYWVIRNRSTGEYSWLKHVHQSD